MEAPFDRLLESVGAHQDRLLESVYLRNIIMVGINVELSFQIKPLGTGGGGGGGTSKFL